MDDLRFREITLHQDTKVDNALMALIRRELNSERSISSFAQNIDHPSGNGRILGGFISDELVCTNSFIRLPFACEKERLIGYQSAFSAASQNHRGKGLWPRLMKFAEDLLATEGASFIFGYPNQVSHPLFVNKLGYQSMDLHALLIPRVPLWPSRYLARRALPGGENSHAGVISPDVLENIAWKRREGGIDRIEEIRFQRSVAWGRVRREQRLGLPVRYFEIGGLELDSNDHLRGLLESIFDQTKVFFCHLSLNDWNEYLPLFRVRRKRQSPVIIKELGEFTLAGRKLNFFGGMKDTF